MMLSAHQSKAGKASATPPPRQKQMPSAPQVHVFDATETY